MEKNAWYRFMQVIFSHARTSRNRVIIGTRGILTMRAAGLFRVVPALAAMVPLSAAAPPTFTRDIAPILYKHCATCHHPNDIAPMPLLSYKQVRPWAASIKEATLSRKMPPWKADPRVGKWSNDPRLNDAEIAAIKAWVDG